MNLLNESIKIHLVEDNQADMDLLKEAFSKNTIKTTISTSNDGQIAIETLETLSTNSNNLPHLILLDINLPKRNGFEVLNFIKSHQKLKSVPVLMLSSSDAPTDIAVSYRSFANGYLVKPLDVEEWFAMAKKIEDFWFSCAKLPNL